MTDQSWTINPIPDEPNEEATLFGFDKKSDELVNFLTSDKTVTPFVIVIHGEWGSGKSSLLLTTKNKLIKKIQNITNFKVIYFDAWQYESANPAAALVYHMVKPIEDNRIGTAMNIGKLVIDVIARNTLNVSINEMKNHFERSVQSVETLTDQVKKTLNKSLPDGRLIVLIDDLDRCTIENTLDILNSIKLFLSLKQCIFVIAVDIKKVELAWKARYGQDPQLIKEGTSYLEKIFQIKINVPTKTEEDIKKYVKDLIPNIPGEIARMIALAGPKNLRKLKRFLNLASFYASAGSSKVRKYELAIIWILFESIMKKNEKAVTIFRRTPLETGHEFLKWIVDLVPLDNPANCAEHLQKSAAFQRVGGVPSENDELMFKFLARTKFVLEGFKENYTALTDSLKEIVDASEEPKE